MNIPILAAGVALFYCLLLAGAVTRVIKQRRLHSFMQLIGLILPLLPVMVFVFQKEIAQNGFSPLAEQLLLVFYAAPWIIMATGYLLEGFDSTRPRKAEAKANKLEQPMAGDGA